MEQKLTWSVTNGVFSGYILCDDINDKRLEDLGVKVEPEEVWLPFSIDLRPIMLMRVRGFDDDALLTVIEDENGAAFTIAAPYDAIRPHFIASRPTGKPNYK
ncbi:MAG: hypothetical protein KDC00_14845 [Flavobacteriales bacterium]|nr:hypothetical protein [Flavobacteriales bacterium]